MQFSRKDDNGVEEWCLTLEGCFGFEVARAFLAEAKKSPCSGKTRVIFDLSSVDHLESSGLGAMLLVAERMNSRIRSIIRCGDERIWALLHIARLERLFDIVPTGQLKHSLSLSDSSPSLRASAKSAP
ncbi:MAG: STAS domain-containing protein [Thiobacillus sp.]|nr:STAS domain-containing protein [Thiobacillus sp.]